jgi:hypothetical protein
VVWDKVIEKMYCVAATAQTVGELSQISAQCFNLLEFLAVASNLTTNIDCPISSIVKNFIVTETLVQHIDVQLGSTKADSNQIIPALFAKVENCNINVYNNCNFTK